MFCELHSCMARSDNQDQSMLDKYGKGAKDFPRELLNRIARNDKLDSSKRLLIQVMSVADRHDTAVSGHPKQERGRFGRR